MVVCVLLFSNFHILLLGTHVAIKQWTLNCSVTQLLLINDSTLTSRLAIQMLDIECRGLAGHGLCRVPTGFGILELFWFTVFKGLEKL